MPRSIRQIGASSHQAGHEPPRGLRSIAPAPDLADDAVRLGETGLDDLLERLRFDEVGLDVRFGCVGHRRALVGLVDQAARAVVLLLRRRERAVERPDRLEPEAARRQHVQGQLELPLLDQLRAGDDLGAQLVIADQREGALDVDPVDRTPQPELAEVGGREVVSGTVAEPRLEQLRVGHHRPARKRVAAQEAIEDRVEAGQRDRGRRGAQVPAALAGDLADELARPLAPARHALGRGPPLAAGALAEEALERLVNDAAVLERLRVRPDPPRPQLVVDEPAVGAEVELLERRGAEEVVVVKGREHVGMGERARAGGPRRPGSARPRRRRGRDRRRPRAGSASRPGVAASTPGAASARARSWGALASSGAGTKSASVARSTSSDSSGSSAGSGVAAGERRSRTSSTNALRGAVPPASSLAG